jgi:phosphoglycerate dehydrogenase-like enzyme
MKVVAVVPPGPQDRGALPFPDEWEVVMINTLAQLNDEILAGADVMLITHHNPLDREALEPLQGLKLVQQIGVGVDSIDLVAARELGVPVANVSKANDAAVAEYVIMAMIWAMRRMGEAIELESKGTVAVPVMIARGCFELRGRTLGIVGFGAVAGELAPRARAMGMELLSHDIVEVSQQERDLGVRRVAFETVLAESDVVSIHVPLTDRTRHMFGPDELAKMKQGSYLINASRGGIVEEAALADALRSGHLAGAAVDVLEVEPMEPDNPLATAPNVLLTPHMAGSTTDAVNYMLRKSFENCARIAAGEEPEGRVC